MTEGIRSPNLPLGTNLGEFIGHEIVGPTKSLRRFSHASVLGALEAVANSFTVGGGVIFTTLSQALSNLNYNVNQMAWVIQDPTPANNGVYQKTGSSGSGSWARRGDLPYSFYRAVNEGAGTPNAIQATNGYPMASKNALIVVNVTDTNTDTPVTLSLNGSTPLTIKTASGNDPVVGGLTAGMMIAGYIDQGGTQFRMLSDQASAAIQAACEAAAATAVAARDIATGAMSVFEATVFSTLTLAQAYSPAMAPDYIRLEGRAAIGDGGQALYKKALSEPSHSGKFSITLDDGTTVVWFELAEEVLRPEHFGAIGVDAAGDTAAWVALVSVANARGGKIKVQIDRDLMLLGTATASDSQTFTNFTSIWIKGNDSEVYQHSRLSKTFKFVGTGKVKVTGITFVGYAEQQIDHSETPDEIDFNTSSGNAVAAIYAENLQELNLARVTTRNHAGRDIHCSGVLHLKGRDLDLVGLGPVYNNPVGDGHQGNGEDAAIYHIPKIDNIPGLYYDPAVTTAWRQTLDICNSSIKWHSFGIRTILNAAIILHGNYFGETPGQHHVYDTDSDGHDIVGNVFEGARQSGYKMQYENLAGFNYGKLWQASTAYNVGDVVRAVSIAWVCKTAHTSGGSFSSTNWNQHPRFIRRGGVWTGNQFKNCGTGIGIIESSGVNARNVWSEGYVISGNFFENCADGAMYIDRLWKSLVTGNNVQGGNYGIFGKNFSGSITKNTFWTQGKNSIALSISKTSDIRGNVFANYGELGGGNDEKVAVLLYAPNGATEPPDRSAAPRVFYVDNGHLHMQMDSTTETYDAPGAWLFYSSDSRLWLEVVGTWGTATSRLGRVDGTLGYKYRNHFSGYYNTAQNEPTWALSNWVTQWNYDANGTATDLQDAVATFLSIMNGKRVIHTTG